MPSHGKDDARNLGATAPARPAVIFGSAAEAAAALAAAGPDGVTLLSHPDAAGFPGPRIVAAMVARAAAAHPGVPYDAVLHCGSAPGHALHALRAGWRRLVLDPSPPAFPAVASAAAEVGAAILPAAPVALDLSRVDLRRPGGHALIARHLRSHGTGARPPP